MNIIMNVNKKFANLVITMTPQEVNENLVIYNGKRVNDIFKIDMNSCNFQIKIQSKGEF